MTGQRFICLIHRIGCGPIQAGQECAPAYIVLTEQTMSLEASMLFLNARLIRHRSPQLLQLHNGSE